MGSIKKMLDYKTIWATVIAGVILAYGGWLTLGVLAAERTDIQVKALQDEQQAVSEQIKETKKQIQELQAKAATKEDVQEVKKLVEKLLDLELKRTK